MSGRTTGLLLAIPCLLVAASAHAQPTPSASTDTSAAPPSEPVPAAVHADAPPSPPPPPPAPVEPVHADPPDSSFARTPYTLSTGEGAAKWKLTLYGFVEFDAMHDSTQSYNDYMGNAAISRDNTYGGQHGRLQFTPRNTRLGIRFASPEWAGLKPSGVLEGDFFGVDNSASAGGNEQKLFNSPTYRIRHAYFKLENSVADILVGQYYYLFGNQPNYFPMSVEFLGLPNMVFGRTTQVRLTHVFKTDAINFEFAVAAMRPPQRDSELPEGQAGLRLLVNDWKGIHTPGNGGTTADPLSIGVSGLVRDFKVKQFSGTGYNGDVGWAVSVDGMIPIIPVKNSEDRGNALTLTGSFVNGSGYGDMYTGALGNVPIPNLANPTMAATAPTANIDPAMVGYDKGGFLHTIDWQTFTGGIQWYLPPSGRFIASANFTEASSGNVKDVFGASASVIRLARYIDGNLWFDATPAVRFGISYQYTTQTYADEQTATNHRAMALGLYFF